MAIDIGEHCVDCRRSVAFGSGLFVNRIPADNGDLDGYLCVECLSEECETCGEITPEWTARNEIIQCDRCAADAAMLEAMRAFEVEVARLTMHDPELHGRMHHHWVNLVDYISDYADGPI